MVVSIASDHAGYELRQKVRKYLEEKGFEVLDGGAPNGTDSYSYVDAGIKVAEDVTSGKAERGIAICGTGIGISLVCNKYKGIRCALCTNLAFGERVVGLGVALGMIDAFFEEEFAGGRHATRVNGIKEIEEKHFK